MSRLKWSIFTMVVIVCPWGPLHAHLCDNVFRQADKLIVKPEVYNLVVKDKITFKVFLQNNMDSGIAEISLVGDSSAFEITSSPRKMSIPSGQRAYFEVAITPKPGIKTGNYPVTFRLVGGVGGKRLIKSFSLTTGEQGLSSGTNQTNLASTDHPIRIKRSSERRLSGPVTTTTGMSRATSRADPTPYRGITKTNEIKISPVKTMAKPEAVMPSRHLLPVHSATSIPQIDGVINDPAWKSAAVLANFSSVGGGQAVYDTTGLLLYDPQNLYVGIYCNDEDTETLTDRDSIELQLAKEASGKPAYSFWLAPTGRVTLQQISTEGKALCWPASGIRYVIGKEKRSWTLEMVIPFSALNVPSSSAVPRQWYLRVIRTKASGHAEKSYWAPDATGYNSEKGFGTLQLVP